MRLTTNTVVSRKTRSRINIVAMLQFRMLLVVFAGLLVACNNSVDSNSGDLISQDVITTSTALTPGKTASNKPNIILILADDIGIETVGAYGGEYVTPRIDSIARAGVRFDNAHAMPVCTPSRVRLLTGKYNFRNYREFAELPPNETVVSEMLQARGYKTLVAGKWQLAGRDGQSGTLPEDAGFDEYFVWNLQKKGKGSRYWEPTLFDNGVVQTYDETEFGPDIVNRYVLNFIDSNSNRPFFIYYPMLLAHNPWVTTPDSLDAKTNKEKFAGMMNYMDKLVGNVLDKVEARGLADNTLILFMGDNGSHRNITSLRNGQAIKGDKAGTTDAGTHVPFLVQWKGNLPKGRVLDGLVEVMDILPTITDVADIDRPADVDGISMLPYLRGDSDSIRDWIFIHYDSRNNPNVGVHGNVSRFVFNKQWKLYGDGRFYNTRIDPLEQSPVDMSVISLDEKDTSSNSGVALSAYSELKQVLDNINVSAR